MDFDKAKFMVEEFFNGQYEVKKFLGEGSFAEVYLVKHNFLDDLRAMKIIKEPLSSTTNIKSIFHEVQLATQLRNENIISIYDAGIISTTFSDKIGEVDVINRKDLAFFVMEYVSGGDLQQYLNSFINSNLVMPVNRALNLIKQILDGLNTLHTANPPIIHRDLKLNNILLSYNASGEIVIKISDFGFAKEVTKGLSDIDIAGTRPYMAPECFKKVASTMTDMYAIGVIFYQLLTNRYPYNMDDFTIEEMMEFKPWEEGLVLPSHYNEKVSKDLDEIVSKCLAIDPNNRYQDATELLEDVEMLIDKSKHSYENNVKSEYVDEYSEYIINDSLKQAFFLAKRENKLNEAIEILEDEVLSDYDIRKCYGEILRMWKSQNPDIKLVSKAFTVNLRGENYKLSCNFLKEAIAYNPSLKNKYAYYIDLWEIFIDLAKYGNLIKAVLNLEELMASNKYIDELYCDIITTLKTYSLEEIIADSIRLANLNKLADAANLMEFAVVSDVRARAKYAYKLSLWKQNMKLHLRMDGKIKKDTIDYAIDLGTTDSVISYFNKGNPVIIKNYKTGDDFTPSAVLIDENDNVQVGVDARDALIEDGKNAVSEFKNNMGFPVPFKFEKSSRVMLPEELSAEILKELRISVYQQYGVNIEHAVICVPANSNPIKTRAVNDAANLAGFRSYSLILEPIAVALAYGLQDTHGMWLIYDLGGGTFNASILKNNGGEIEKVATTGVDNLGGNEFDWAIVDEIFVPKIVEDLNLDDFDRQNPKYNKIFSKLKHASEIAKKDLSEVSKTDIFIHNLFDNYDFTYTLMREELKEIIKPLIKTTFNLVQNLLDENLISISELDKIILAGGSCLSPIVKELLKDEFDIGLEYGINPLTVVAKGAAIYAGSLKKPKLDLNINELSLVVNYVDGSYIGRVFSFDSKLSFLGYSIEFIDTQTNHSSGKMPIKIDGAFKLSIPKGNYKIVIYRDGRIISINEKSPDEIFNETMNIPYLNKTFSMCTDKDFDNLLFKYVDLVKSMDYLNDYCYFIGGIDVLDYIERLLEIAKMDENALSQTSIYINYFETIIDELMDDFEFDNLLENVETKVNIAYEKNLFEIDGFRNRLDVVCQNRDLSSLNEIYEQLIENYVELNRNDVIVESFFNLRYDGIYTTNKRQSNEFIKEGLVALNNSDYAELFEVVKKLYEIDERNFIYQ